MAALCGMLARHVVAPAAEAGGTLRKDKPHAEALPAVLDAWWEQALRPGVAAALRRLAPPRTEGPEF